VFGFAPGQTMSVWRGSGGLFAGLVEVERDGCAGRFELALEAAGAVLRRVALSLPVRSEVAVWDLVADDVAAGDEQVVADRFGVRCDVRLAGRSAWRGWCPSCGRLPWPHPVSWAVSQLGPGRVRPVIAGADARALRATDC
jgi:hypothetical protein